MGRPAINTVFNPARRQGRVQQDRARISSRPPSAASSTTNVVNTLAAFSALDSEGAYSAADAAHARRHPLPMSCRYNVGSAAAGPLNGRGLARRRDRRRAQHHDRRLPVRRPQRHRGHPDRRRRHACRLPGLASRTSGTPTRTRDDGSRLATRLRSPDLNSPHADQGRDERQIAPLRPPPIRAPRQPTRAPPAEATRPAVVLIAAVAIAAGQLRPEPSASAGDRPRPARAPPPRSSVARPRAHRGTRLIRWVAVARAGRRARRQRPSRHNPTRPALTKAIGVWTGQPQAVTRPTSSAPRTSPSMLLHPRPADRLRRRLRPGPGRRRPGAAAAYPDDASAVGR